MSCPTDGFAVLLVHNPSNDTFVVVEETGGRGLWLPAGRVEPGESFEQAALRECKEEAGIDVEIRGIIRVEHSPYARHARMRVIYYAVPKDVTTPLKSVEDEHSVRAFWADFETICGFLRAKKLRSGEIHVFSEYIMNGGPVYPKSILTEEIDDVSPHPVAVFCPKSGASKTTTA